MEDKSNAAIEKLYCTFPRLTEANQQYVLGLAEGLKKAQNPGQACPDRKNAPTGIGTVNSTGGKK